MKESDVLLLNSLLPLYIECANAVLFYGLDPMHELVSDFAFRWNETKPEAQRILQPLVKKNGDYLEIK